MKRFNILSIIVISLFLSACGKLKQNTATVALSNDTYASGENLYYRFNITNPIKAYRVYFTSRFSGRYIMKELPISILYISPQGKRFSDTIKLYLNEGDLKTEYLKNGVWRDYRWLYRDGVRFPEKGIWLISVKNMHQKNLSGLKELGISLMEKE
jgi:gliding motility-associated lipoprotein GldH